MNKKQIFFAAIIVVFALMYQLALVPLVEESQRYVQQSTSKLRTLKGQEFNALLAAQAKQELRPEILGKTAPFGGLIDVDAVWNGEIYSVLNQLATVHHLQNVRFKVLASKTFQAINQGKNQGTNFVLHKMDVKLELSSHLDGPVFEFLQSMTRELPLMMLTSDVQMRRQRLPETPDLQALRRGEAVPLVESILIINLYRVYTLDADADVKP